MTVAMLLLAAGRSTRFGGETPKPFLLLAGKPVLLHAAERLAAVADRARGDELLVVVAPQDRERHLSPLLPALQALGAKVVDGGDSRQQSMARGIAAASPRCDLVLVHDAARPLLPLAATRECLGRATRCGAALLAVPLADTLKRVGAGDRVEATIDRRGVFAAQTPQVIRRELLVRALEHAARNGVEATDDVGLVEAIGGDVQVVPGSPWNLKLTRREDLVIAAALLASGATAEAAP